MKQLMVQAAVAAALPQFAVASDHAAALGSRLCGILARRGAPQSDSELLYAAEAGRSAADECVPGLRGYIESIARPGGPSAITLVGLPVDPEPARLEFTKLLSISLFLGTLGSPMQYRSQNAGKLAALLRAVPNAARNSNASADEFLSHTDDAIVPEPCRTRWISLVGGINESRCPTGYSAIDAVAESLSEPTLCELFQPKYQFRIPFSFNMGERFSKPSPILWHDENDQLSISCPTYNTKTVDETDEVAKGAFAELVVALNRHTKFFVVEPGTALVFNNNRGTHCRRQIDGDRAIYRTYWRPTLDALRDLTGNATGYTFDVSRLLPAA